MGEALDIGFGRLHGYDTEIRATKEKNDNLDFLKIKIF